MGNSDTLGRTPQIDFYDHFPDSTNSSSLKGFSRNVHSFQYEVILKSEKTISISDLTMPKREPVSINKNITQPTRIFPVFLPVTTTSNRVFTV